MDSLTCWYLVIQPTDNNVFALFQGDNPDGGKSVKMEDSDSCDKTVSSKCNGRL